MEEVEKTKRWKEEDRVERKEENGREEETEREETEGEEGEGGGEPEKERREFPFQHVYKWAYREQATSLPVSS